MPNDLNRVAPAQIQAPFLGVMTRIMDAQFGSISYSQINAALRHTVLNLE